jgi:ferredoxin-type protein NapH
MFVWSVSELDRRMITQICATILTNANLKGFLQGKIYKGNLKNICVPGINCYSCPGAIGACPIGAMQSVLGSVKYDFSFYVIGTISLLGIIFGRFICGWLCAFGFIQDLLYKIPTPKIKVNKKIDKVLKYLKYIILVTFVILLPIFLVNEFGVSPPYFCEYVCPAGTLEGGIPLVIANESLRSTLGGLFAWKMFLLICTVAISIFIYRPFCKYVCPLGAFYSLFNKISFFKLNIDKGICTNCSSCVKKCKMNVDVCVDPNSTECIRCGACAKACPVKAINITPILLNGTTKNNKIKNVCIEKNSMKN